MNLPELYLSKPGVSFPEHRVDNDGIIERVRAHYRGPAEKWPMLEAGIRRVFLSCNSQTRYLDENEEEARIADFAIEAVRHCLAVNDTTLDDVDLLLCGGIARQYFEPATAMEVAAKLGLTETHAFDVTSACVGHLEAVQTAAAYMTLHSQYRSAVVCTAEIYGGFLSYDLQSVKDLHMKAAGLTVGNAAACMLLRRTPWPGGCLRIVGMDTYAIPDHWDLCQVPVRGTLFSSSVELMRLGRAIPPRLQYILDQLHWRPEDVDHFVFHQPSETMLRRILENTGADPEKGVYTHHKYGNTASASVGVTFDELLRTRELEAGDKILLGSAAAGFTMVVVAGEWVA